MKKLIKVSLVLALAAILSACNKKDLEIDACAIDQSKVVTQQLNIAPFEKIRISGDFDVQFVQDPKQNVIVTLESNLIDNLNKSVINKEWKLEFVNCENKKTDIPVIISVPDLKAIDISNASSAKSLNEFKLTEVLISTHGNGSIIMDISGETVTVLADGPGNITLSGKANQLNANSLGSGTGYLHLKNFLVPKASVNIKGAALSEVSVTDKLDVNIEGSGKVFYTGNPVVTSNISGSGSVEQSK